MAQTFCLFNYPVNFLSSLKLMSSDFIRDFLDSSNTHENSKID